MIVKHLKLFIIFTLLVVAVFVSGLLWIEFSTNKNLFNNSTELPYNKVGLIPGCNKYVADGVINTYYTQRIEAGVKLYNEGKINYILVSGDNAHVSYDEPRQMRNSLVEAGIPNDRIVSDYAGFRTLDTIVRAKEVFQLRNVTLISQSFQNKRGVFIGNEIELNIVAYNADSGEENRDIKTRIREELAKVKMLLDLYIFNTGPRFLGDTIAIGE